ncbi:MAG: carboxylesterase/lipase family protein [Polyangiales bacterium]
MRDGGGVQGDASRIDASGNDASAGDAGDASAQDAPVIETKNGSLRGKVVGNGVRSFLGIPYAKPPLGELRWKPPQAAESWSGTRDATQFGKRCAQVASATLQNEASQDEDCLYLNVWAPRDAEKLPVMFWIHGGGNVNGSASEPVPFVKSGVFYDGTKLAERDVVVVSINYRLGVFGFFDHAALGADGANQGLRDQRAALAWVAENAAAFGGDPQNVTIFGESAGSYDVCAHVASPLSRGAFHKAISQSGGCTTLQTTAAEAEQQATTFATAVGCTGDAALTCLRGKTVAELLAAPSDFGPNVDGAFMPEQWRALYDRGEIAKVPYILGSNTDEGTLFAQGVTIADQASYDAALASAFAAASAPAVAALYPASNFPNGKPNAFHAAYARAVGDARLVCTTHDAAARALAAGSKVYAYNFDIFAPIGDLGATHGAELTSVFGTSPAFAPGSPALAASEQIQRYWTRFAKTGDPNGAPDPTWPALARDSDVRANLALTTTTVTDFRKKECAFWSQGYAMQFAAP